VTRILSAFGLVQGAADKLGWLSEGAAGSSGSGNTAAMLDALAGLRDEVRSLVRAKAAAAEVLAACQKVSGGSPRLAAWAACAPARRLCWPGPGCQGRAAPLARPCASPASSQRPAPSSQRPCACPKSSSPSVPPAPCARAAIASQQSSKSLEERVGEALGAFQQQITSMAAAGDTRSILAACDTLRDDTLVELGIRLEDRPDGARRGGGGGWPGRGAAVGGAADGLGLGLGLV
jgi:cysteinyl-tRNA synthetase